MNQKLMSLTVGVLAALAVAALPAAASAGEFTADCENGAATCAATISGGVAELSNTSNERIECSAVTGTSSITNGSSTGSAQLNFTGCVEKVSGFNFSCTNTATAGKIATNTMVTHLIRIDPISAEKPTGTPGILLTGSNTTFTCAAFLKRTVTGDIIGHIENPECGEFKASHAITFEKTINGHQKYKQVTTEGTIFDLIGSNHSGGAYITSAQTGTGTTTYTGTKVKLTCKVLG